MPPVPLPPEAMTSLEVIRGTHVPSLPEGESRDAQGSSSNEQDPEENVTDRVPTLKAKSGYCISGQ